MCLFVGRTVKQAILYIADNHRLLVGVQRSAVVRCADFLLKSDPTDKVPATFTLISLFVLDFY